jgi:DNA-binding winged helix-turn-helix (wHTH) protein
MGRRSFADVTLDPRNGWLLCGDTRVDVRPAVARLLAALLAAHGNTVTADVLRRAMRKAGHPEVSMDNLRVSIFDLRAALVDAGSLTQVANRIGYGWRLNAGPLPERALVAVRADPPPLDQPAPAARLPQPSRLAHPQIEIARAAHRDHGAEGVELRRANARRQVRADHRRIGS